ncbi:putative chitin binding protein [Blastocystis sp. subtype 1]
MLYLLLFSVVLSNDSCDGSLFIRCTSSVGVPVSGSCTEWYTLCNNVEWSNPMPAARGTRCLNGVLIRVEDCTSVVDPTASPEEPTTSPKTPECSFSGYRCVNSAGEMQTTCSDYYRTCDEEILSPITAVPAGKKCYNGELVDASALPCEPVEYTPTPPARGTTRPAGTAPWRPRA